MFQRAFHRFHNCVDCTIFGSKKPVAIRALNSHVAPHNGEKAESQWDSHDNTNSSSSSSNNSSSTSSSHHCALSYFLKQLSVYAPFPNWLNVEEVEERANARFMYFSHFSKHHSQVLAVHPLYKLFELRLKSSAPFHSPLSTSAFARPFSSKTNTFEYSSLETSNNENPILPQLSLQAQAQAQAQAPISNPIPVSSIPKISQETQTTISSFTPPSVTTLSLQLPEGHYKGEVVDGVQHGYGTFVYTNGDTYSGEWSNGLADGRGRMIYTHHGMYDGEWKAGNRHGIGLYIPLEDDSYVGEWRNNERHGYGRQFSATGQLLYDGQWERNERNGSGIAQFGKNEMYHGQWLNGKMHGNGCWSRGENKEIQWEGEWENGTNVRGVWHIDTELASKGHSGEVATESFDIQSKTAFFSQYGEKSHAKVIVVHGVQPHDQIVVQYQN